MNCYSTLHGEYSVKKCCWWATAHAKNSGLNRPWWPLQIPRSGFGSFSSLIQSEWAGKHRQGVMCDESRGTAQSVNKGIEAGVEKATQTSAGQSVRYGWSCHFTNYWINTHWQAIGAPRKLAWFSRWKSSPEEVAPTWYRCTFCVIR